MYVIRRLKVNGHSVSFPEVKRLRVGVDRPPNADVKEEVKERVELYL